MIKFFRHIRQSMINQNRTKKYLLYAIGEIILVVIGILIALQINNWNEARKVNLGVDTQLRSMKKELQQDIVFYQDLIENDKKRIEFLQSLITRTFDTIELANAPAFISFNYDKRAFGTAYNALKQNGETDLIDNIQLTEAMIAYYEEICAKFNNESEWHKTFVTSNVEPYIMTHLPMDSSARSDPKVVLNELPTIQFQNILNLQLWNHRNKERFGKNAMAEASALIEQINKTLLK